MNIVNLWDEKNCPFINTQQISTQELGLCQAMQDSMD